MKRSSAMFLLCLNLLVCAVLFILYYFAFDFQWGTAGGALTWGLPVALAAVFALVIGIISFVKRRRNWAVAVLAIAAIAVAYMLILVYSFSYALLPPDEDSAEIKISEENTILAKVLSEHSGGMGYTIVKPYTVSPDKGHDGLEFFRGHDFSGLAELFYELNETPSKLSLSSSIEDGYYIDYSGVFSRYAGTVNNAPVRLSDIPLRWAFFHPQAKSYTGISVPVYDPDTGYFMIYIETRSYSMRRPGGGSGLYVYRYVDGKLTFIDGALMKVG